MEQTQLNKDYNSLINYFRKNLTVIFVYFLLELPLIIFLFIIALNILNWISIIALTIGWQIYLAAQLFIIATLKIQMDLKINELKSKLSDDMR